MWAVRLVRPDVRAFVNGKLNAKIAELFCETAPEGCPSDPVEKQAFLRALAFKALLEDEGARAGAGRPEIVVVVDTTQRDEVSGGPAVDWGLPVELPERVLVDLYGRAAVHPVVVRNGAVLYAEGEMNLGRASRVASKAQRRALRALYRTCAVPGCRVPFEQTKIHHLRDWAEGGLTNLGELIPLCWAHHDCVHTKGWQIALTPDRHITVRLPDRRTLRGPPTRQAAA